MTSYDKIYKKFLRSVPDPDLAEMNSSDRALMLFEYLDAALGYIQLEGLKLENDLSDRDDELLCFNSDLTTGEIEGIVLYMIVAWYEPIVNSMEHTILFYGSKDEKWTNQKDHWQQSLKTQNNYRTLARKKFGGYRRIHNSYTDGES